MVQIEDTASKVALPRESKRRVPAPRTKVRADGSNEDIWVKANQTRPLGAQPCVRSLLIDNYDSYTYNLYQLLSVVNGCEAIVVRNDARWEDLCALEFDNIVISPGPGRPDVESDFGICAKVLANTNVPVLGVCLGHQGIALEYGGQVVRDTQIFHGQRSRIFHAEHPLFAGVPQGFWAVRYHSLLAVEPIPQQLAVIAWTKERSIMALAAVDRPLYGVQFHPESWMTEHGVKIMENFRDLTWNAMLVSAAPTRAGYGVSVSKPVPKEAREKEGELSRSGRLRCSSSGSAGRSMPAFCSRISVGRRP